MNSIRRLAGLILVLAGSAWPQGQQSPELKQLQPIVGQWTCSGETKTSQVQEAAANFECNWDKQGRMLACQLQGQTGTVRRSEVFAYAYDTGAKVYTLAGLTSAAVPFAWSGPLQAGKFNLTQEGTLRNKPVRYTLEMSHDATADTATYIWGMSVAGGPHVLTQELKCKKQK